MAKSYLYRTENVRRNSFENSGRSIVCSIEELVAGQCKRDTLDSDDAMRYIDLETNRNLQRQEERLLDVLTGRKLSKMFYLKRNWPRRGDVEAYTAEFRFVTIDYASVSGTRKLIQPIYVKATGLKVSGGAA